MSGERREKCDGKHLHVSMHALDASCTSRLVPNPGQKGSFFITLPPIGSLQVNLITLSQVKLE